MTMVAKIGEREIKDIAAGAAILGSGGGGDPYLGSLMAITTIRKHGEVVLLDPTEIGDESFVIPTAMMGAPTILIERIPNVDQALRALTDLEEYLGRKADATMALEAGGVNSTIPFAVAAKSGLPVIDADGMGRAFPELQMESFAVYGLNGAPIALRDERGNSSIVNTSDNMMLEWLARGITIRLGGSSHIAEYAMTGAEVKRTAIRNSLSLAMRLGQKVREASESKESPIEALLRATEDCSYGKAIPLFEGKITDVERRMTAGFATGKILIEGLEDYEERSMTVVFQNENLLASVDARIVATVPDLIAILEQNSGHAITTENLKYGQRVTVLGIPTPEIMRAPQALEIWGPRYFGLDTDFIPLELRHKEYYRNSRLSGEKEKYRNLLS